MSHETNIPAAADALYEVLFGTPPVRTPATHVPPEPGMPIAGGTDAPASPTAQPAGDADWDAYLRSTARTGVEVAFQPADSPLDRFIHGESR
ncbi:hypothetical protein [Raineyella sp. W15-4]|uniref:hypothetical protein n=1 Tax=Raineyella sp. W15-4 TaxID=3081651 RepID=UPI00295498CC|nr:hypothetical protein [Raineyella sp. W15-4]WOQ15634.1 hypothetical protein R0145_10320 [Raineyella sp. W15-4]